MIIEARPGRRPTVVNTDIKKDDGPEVKSAPPGTRTSDIARQRDEQRKGHPLQPIGESRNATMDLAYERDRKRRTG